MKDKKRATDYPSKKGFMNVVGMYPTDPLGSYTGNPLDREELPVQDADDL